MILEVQHQRSCSRPPSTLKGGISAQIRDIPQIVLLTVQTCLCDIAHSMLDSPDDTVHEQLELVWRDGQQGYHTGVSQRYGSDDQINVPGKHVKLIERSSLKKPTRCSGNSAKSWLIMLSVGSNTASKMAGTCGVNRGYMGSFSAKSNWNAGMVNLHRVYGGWWP